MKAILNGLRRLGFLWKRRKLEKDLQEELGQHLEGKVRENVSGGVGGEEGRRGGVLQFGNPAVAQEQRREKWSYAWLESLVQDLSYAVRQLRKSSGFSAVVIATLAIGIGANSAIFSVVNAVLLRPLPYRDPTRLVAVGSDTKEADDGISYKHYQAWKSQSLSFEELAVYYRNSGWSRATLTGEEPEMAQGTAASAHLFQVMAGTPAVGRTFVPGEEARREHADF